VGGLLAERLGKVPISGSSITVDGYELVAESVGGRRNRITSVVVIPDEAIGARVVPLDESAVTTKDQA
jgi:Mg2+/Co2+ transporter CorC